MTVRGRGLRPSRGPCRGSAACSAASCRPSARAWARGARRRGAPRPGARRLVRRAALGGVLAVSAAVIVATIGIRGWTDRRGRRCGSGSSSSRVQRRARDAASRAPRAARSALVRWASTSRSSGSCSITRRIVNPFATCSCSTRWSRRRAGGPAGRLDRGAIALFVIVQTVMEGSGALPRAACADPRAVRAPGRGRGGPLAARRRLGCRHDRARARCVVHRGAARASLAGRSQPAGPGDPGAAYERGAARLRGAQVQAEQETLQTIIDCMADAVLFADPVGKLRLRNRAALGLWQGQTPARRSCGLPLPETWAACSRRSRTPTGRGASAARGGQTRRTRRATPPCRTRTAARAACHGRPRRDRPDRGAGEAGGARAHGRGRQARRRPRARDQQPARRDGSVHPARAQGPARGAPLADNLRTVLRNATLQADRRDLLDYARQRPPEWTTSASRS